MAGLVSTLIDACIICMCDCMLQLLEVRSFVFTTVSLLLQRTMKDNSRMSATYSMSSF